MSSPAETSFVSTTLLSDAGHLVHSLPKSTTTSSVADSTPSKSQGCTCGRCTDGWFSPRMQYRLFSEADMASDMMSRVLNDNLDPAPGIEYLPQPIQQGIISKAFYAGYADVVSAISRVLDRPGRAGIPSVAQVMTVLPITNADAQPSSESQSKASHVATFFADGGDVRHALAFIVHAAMITSAPPLGDGSWGANRRAEFVEAGEDGGLYEALPACAHDVDFAALERRLGLPPLRALMSKL